MDDACEMVITLRDLPSAIDAAVFTLEKWPLIIDSPDRQGARFLNYQAGACLNVMRPADMDKERLRYALVSTLKAGTTLTIDFGSISPSLDDVVFTEGFFPRGVLDKSAVLLQPFWEPLLREDKGDPTPVMFEARAGFRLVFVCSPTETGDIPPDLAALEMAVIRIKQPGGGGGGGGEGGGDGGDGGDGDDVGVAGMYGVKVVKRNSEEMVEDAFDGELEKVKAFLEQGFDLESTDAHLNTALNEAASQGHSEVVAFLLGEGADPNAANDQGRTPLYRASYNGQHEMVIALLKSGGDPDVKTNDADSPSMCAKTDDTRAFLDAWDRSVVLKLKEERDTIIKAKLESRIKNAAEREMVRFFYVFNSTTLSNFTVFVYMFFRNRAHAHYSYALRTSRPYTTLHLMYHVLLYTLHICILQSASCNLHPAPCTLSTRATRYGMSLSGSRKVATPTGTSQSLLRVCLFELNSFYSNRIPLFGCLCATVT